MWTEDVGAQVERTSAPLRPSGHVLPEPPGDKNYTPEGRQEVWAEILGTDSYTLRDVEDYLAERHAERMHEAADEKERHDETLGIWPDGGIRTNREQRELGLRQYVQRSLDVLTGGAIGNIGFGLSSVFGADDETALGIGEMAQTVGSFFPFGRGGKARGQASRPKGKGGRGSSPSRGPRVPAHRRPGNKAQAANETARPSPATVRQPDQQTPQPVAAERSAQRDKESRLDDPSYLGSLNLPVRSRHRIRAVNRNSRAKNQNSVAEPSVDVAADVAAIRAGNAKRVGSQFHIHGRIYEVHEGSLHPVSGAGVHRLSRGAFRVLGIYNDLGDTPAAARELSHTPSLTEQDKVAGRTAWLAGKSEDEE
jgi:hypothetical protein